MKTFAISAFVPANSSAERAIQRFEIFDTLEEAKEAANKALKSDQRDVALWTLHAIPTLVTKIEWESPAS